MRLFIVFIICFLMINAKMIRDNSLSDNAVVFDTSTHLMWQDDNDVQLDTRTWANAASYCESLDKKGYTDWRLPNINELNTIVDDTKYEPALSDIFYYYSSGKYWSSTTSAYNTDYGWFIDFNTSNLDYSSKTNTMYTRCVRDM